MSDHTIKWHLNSPQKEMHGFVNIHNNKFWLKKRLGDIYVYLLLRLGDIYWEFWTCWQQMCKVKIKTKTHDQSNKYLSKNRLVKISYRQTKILSFKIKKIHEKKF